MILVVLAVLVALGLVRLGRSGRGEAGSLRSRQPAGGGPSPGMVWFEAMRAEHSAIEGRRQRRRFRAGCVWALLSAPSTDRAATTSRAVLAVAVASAIAAAGYGLVHYPMLRSGSWLAYLAVFAVFVTVYAALGIALSSLEAPRVRHIGLVTALPAIALSAVGAHGNGAISFAMASSPIVLPVVAAWRASRVEQRWTAGAVAGVCCTLVAGLMAFAGYAVATYLDANRPATATLRDEFRRSGARDYRTWLVGDNLGGATFLLGIMLIVGTVVGIAAALVCTPPAPTPYVP